MRLRRVLQLSVLLLVMGSRTLALAQPIEGEGKEPKSHKRIMTLLSILDSTPSGRVLLEKAQKFWNAKDLKEVAAHIEWDHVSRTDALLLRHYHPQTGEEIRERKVVVKLRRDLRISDLILDLSHELTHAVLTQAWDPYDPNLKVSSYILNALEGGGGEIDAVTTECTVASELSSQYGVAMDRCLPYLDENTRSVSRERVKEEFYKSGRWYSSISERIADEKDRFPSLSDAAPSLYSSTGRAPYPYALIVEYDVLTKTACENTARRLKESGRSPAEAGANERDLLEKRCSHRRTVGTQTLPSRQEIHRPIANAS